MNFQIAGRRYELAPDDVMDATRNIPPDVPDGRYKYFVKLHNRQYPIKQVIALVTGLESAEFISHAAYRILTALGFDISGQLPSEVVSAGTSNGDGRALSLLVVFEPDEDGWVVASCPTLPGCHSQGRTRAEALKNIGEAIRGYLASMREHGAPMPASSEFEVVEVTA